MAKKTNTTEHTAKRFETWEEVVENFDLKKGPDASSAKHEKTTEERLLEALGPFDFNEGRVPPKDDMHTDNVIDLLRKLGRKFSPMDPITVADLVSIGREYARKFIADLSYSVVRDNGDDFSWISSEKYAPNITFRADNSLRLRYTEDGKFITAINYFDADDVLPLLPFNHHGNSEDAIIAWGCAKGAGKEWSFAVKSEVMKSSDLLLAVPWGGAHSSTRGQTADEVKKFSKLVKYFEKQSSKSGGEGVDFYIIDFATDGQLLSAALRSEQRLEKEDTQAEICCHAKWLAIRRLNLLCDEMEQEFTAKSQELDRLHDEIMTAIEEELGIGSDDDNFVLIGAPAKPGIFTELPRDFSLRDSVGKLLDDREKLHDLQLKFQLNYDTCVLIARSYRDLVPKYAQLAPIVCEKCHGRLEIWSNAVRVFLPGSAEDGSHVLTSHQFNFTEKKLGDCIKLIRDYMTAEEQAARANKVALEDLSKEN